MPIDLEVKDKRRFNRRFLHQAVSFSCVQGKETKIWHLGWIENVSIAGMKIVVNRQSSVQAGDQIKILCLPRGAQHSHAQEAVQIQAEVVWQSRDGLEIGVRYC